MLMLAINVVCWYTSKGEAIYVSKSLNFVGMCSSSRAEPLILSGNDQCFSSDQQSVRVVIKTQRDFSDNG